MIWIFTPSTLGEFGVISSFQLKISPQAYLTSSSIASLWITDDQNKNSFSIAATCLFDMVFSLPFLYSLETVSPQNWLVYQWDLFVDLAQISTGVWMLPVTHPNCGPTKFANYQPRPFLTHLAVWLGFPFKTKPLKWCKNMNCLIWVTNKYIVWAPDYYVLCCAVFFQVQVLYLCCQHSSSQLVHLNSMASMTIIFSMCQH